MSRCNSSQHHRAPLSKTGPRFNPTRINRIHRSDICRHIDKVYRSSPWRCCFFLLVTGACNHESGVAGIVRIPPAARAEAEVRIAKPAPMRNRRPAPGADGSYRFSRFLPATTRSRH